jgi:hypothetical protein
MLRFEFALFWADVLSDWNCLVTFFFQRDWGLAAAQIAIIAVPMATGERSNSSK